MRILDCYFADYIENEIRRVSPEEVEEMEAMLEPLFIFCVTWSIGCTSNLEGRQKFDKHLKELMGEKHPFPFPDEGACFDFKWDKNDKVWKNWKETIAPYSVDPKLGYSEIVVPIVDGDPLIGVLDIDSPVFCRFDEHDQAGLEMLVATFVEATDLGG